METVLDETSLVVFIVELCPDEESSDVGCERSVLPSSEYERVDGHDGTREEPSDPSEPDSSELPEEPADEVASLELLENSDDVSEFPVEPPPPPPPDDPMFVTGTLPPLDGTWSGSSQRSSCGGSGHWTRGSSAPTSKRNRGA